ncbi:hypothetical protein P691DRAFT_801235 [Macrolepiota fuliginosa MF-IS2]|uniref:CN hydrolase domain-containing protein n=1 Tax=Macrolepiota fuliginosa MF-IS2 TaxID=1400762 RepID=A0A9P5XF94_9AGAR|nr:hypothetical protein P691DRAFT_801235 [Macrolepiota fuliginosa MF-IS2]
MKSLQALFSYHPHITYVSLAGILSIFSLGPTPGMIPIILNLSILLVYSRQIFPTFAQHTVRNTSALWASLTIGGSIPRFRASIHALSQPSISIVSLFLLSGITSFLSIGALFLENRFGRNLNPFESSRLFLFPAIWATFWATIASLSPFGMLSTWSPVEGTGAYDWLVPWLGPEYLNWVVAAWAVVVSEAATSLYMTRSATDDEYDHPSADDLIETDPASSSHHPSHHPVGNRTSGVRTILAEKNKTALLAAVLVLLTVPSYIASPLPLSLEDVSKVTPLAVGCALPTFDEHKVHEFGFEHYLFESQRLDPSANFILWPEGAVRFRSDVERNTALAELREKIHHAFVGVAFEETLNDPEDPRNRNGIRRTGIAIVSNKSSTPHLVYYKRHLVPIAESFSLTHSREPPSAFTAEVVYSKRSRYPVAGHKREVNVTTSICLDFSAPSQFDNLDMKPGLILAPARTWDVTVGYTMWKQASQRAHEIGSTLLWCDGGAGGVSGVAGQGLNEVVQRGPGSWVRNIGLEYPFHDQRTFFARYGNSALILFWALVAGVPLVQRSEDYMRTVLKWFRRRTASSGPPVGHLLDA